MFTEGRRGRVFSRRPQACQKDSVASLLPVALCQVHVLPQV